MEAAHVHTTASWSTAITFCWKRSSRSSAVRKNSSTKGKTMQKALSIWLSVVLLGVATASLSAQVTTTSISGTVIDPSGASVPNAEVVATNVGTGLLRATKTGSAGEYRIDQLPVGE